MSRSRRPSTLYASVLVALLVGMICVPVSAQNGADDPIHDVEGLAAWYTVRSLHGRTRDGEKVDLWKDSSGKGRDLKSDGDGQPVQLQTQQINGQPALYVQPNNSYRMAKPLRLEDHTIFLVYSAGRERCALFQGIGHGDDGVGIVLRDKGTRDYYLSGSKPVFASTATPRTDEFVVAMLGRRSGVLHSFVNGVDYSSRERFEKPLNVGRFFRISLTRAVRFDGTGLIVAEMIFYSRYLKDSERTAITLELAERYGIELTAAARVRPPEEYLVRARLGTDKNSDVNVEQSTAIAWNKQIRMEDPLRHDAEKNWTKLYCTKDGTNLRLFVSLALQSSTPGAAVRVLLLKNEEEYLAAEGQTGPMTGEQTARIVVRFAGTLTMNAGDYIEVVTLGEGEPGAVTLDPSESEFVAELE